MKKEIKIPDSIGLRTTYKRKFSLGEMYKSFIVTPSAMADMIKNNRKKIVDKDFIERLQLAVTEVNGCAACSYAHTYMALKQGMSSEEIYSFLSGDESFITKDEAKAIIFAQHFADARGLPKKETYNEIIKEYGAEKAKIILSASQLMIAGNMYGIPYSAFQSRLKGKPYKDSSILYELGMQIGGLLILPIALVHGFLRRIMGISNVLLD